jgi:hypothetical protein
MFDKGSIVRLVSSDSPKELSLKLNIQGLDGLFIDYRLVVFFIISIVSYQRVS